MTTSGLAKLITALLNSLSGLSDVMILAIAFFFIYGIVGLQIFSGPEMHAVCRLTPFPVFSNWTEGVDPALYRCLDAPNYDILSSSDR